MRVVNAQYGFARLSGRGNIALPLCGRHCSILRLPVRICCGIVISFPIASPRRRRRSGEFPERPPKMHRIGKAGGLGHIVERGAGDDGERGRLDVDLRCRRRVVRAVRCLPGAQQGCARRLDYRACAFIRSRAMISFMICAVPSPISRPMTSRSRCWCGCRSTVRWCCRGT